MKLLGPGVITLYILMTLQTGAAQAPRNTFAPLTTGENIEQLPEIVVSASRVPIEAKAVGSSVTVITADEIERKQVRAVSDLLREVPGIAVHRSGTMGALTAVRIRGADSDHTLVIIDGVEMNDPSNINATFDFADLLAADIERIEILRGPQSGPYGSDAIGGVINIITKKGYGPMTAYLNVEGGSFRTGSVSGRVRGGGETFHYSLGGTGFRTSGISIASGNERDGYKNQTYNARLGIQPFGALEIELVGRYVKAHVETDNVPSDSDDQTDSNQTMGRSRFKYSLFDGSWKHAFGAGTNRKKTTFISAWGPTKYTGRKLRLDYETTVFLETPAMAGAAHAISLLVERERDSQMSDGEASKITHTGYSTEYQVGFREQLFLSGSIRRDKNQRFKDTTTFRITAAHVLDPKGVRLHSSYGTGVKNPTLSQLFQQYGRTGPNTGVEPEESIGWDVGVEHTLIKDRLSLDMTYFNNRLINLIYWDDAGTDTGDDDFYDNLNGTSKIHGLEFSVKAKPVERLTVSAQYTYTQAKDPDNERLPRRPTHLASVNLGYKFLDGKAGTELGIDYNGSQLNRTADPVMLGAFVLVNIAANYKLNRQMKLVGRIDNLFDTSYEEVPGYHTTGIGIFAGVRGTFEFAD